MRFSFMLPIIFWVAAVSTAGLYGGRIDGHLRPVVSPVELSDPKPWAEGGSIWRGKADKLRSCQFKGMEFFIGTRLGVASIEESGFTDPPAANDIGELTWSGIWVKLDRTTVEGFAFADVLHQCYLWQTENLTIPLPWITRTKFYDPPKATP